VSRRAEPPDFPQFGGVIRQIGQLHRSGQWCRGTARACGGCWAAFSTETMQASFTTSRTVTPATTRSSIASTSAASRRTRSFKPGQPLTNCGDQGGAEPQVVLPGRDGAALPLAARPHQRARRCQRSCRDVYELLSQGRPRLAITCVDQDEEAIAYAARLLADYAGQVTFVKMNALRCRLNREFDFVWSAGLFDYFTDRLFVRGLQSLYRHVRPGGEMLIGNFSPNNIARDYMEVIGEWFLHHRTAEQLLELAEQAGLEYRHIQVDGSRRVNLFLRVRR